MASLANITSEFRTVGKVAAFAGIILFLLFLGFKAITFVLSQNNPGPPAQMRFGKLPQFVFPQVPQSSAEYRINTSDGFLPKLPRTVLVYKITQPSKKFSARQDARLIASRNGYDKLEQQVAGVEDTYSWQDAKGNTLRYNSVTNNFEIIANPAAVIPTILPGSLPEKKQIISNAFSVIEKLGVDTTQLEKDPTLLNIDYYQNSGSALIPVQSENTATAARVLFKYSLIPMEAQGTTKETMKKVIQKLPVVFSNPDIAESLMHITFIPSDYDLTPFQAKFYMQKVDMNESSDYYLKTAQQAFDDLKKGDAYIINAGNNAQVDITSVSLAYYVGSTPQEYLYPVVVFKGDKFTAYVSALTPSSF